MKPKITPTGIERALGDEDFIVSKTDPQGRILYANRIFIALSGYTEAELLGRQHNIIRHPDMPRAVFKRLWDTINAGQEFFGYIKNMAKDGSHYWVFATVTPDKDPAGTIIGYTSVRRKPSLEAVRAISELYAQMLAAERAAGVRDAIAAGQTVLERAINGKSYEQFVLTL
ncbi:PAS domain-containing protein [Caldichromatium japonicum]|uniref:PAS domain-containing protein n=1 Tax=Caldichromatium japonicum TaxID=2699430 RepID=A0A6G7VEN6_9GAMM|nr:PAS domain-containing protein [Caldichromatium japonicum]QIK38434.1 PAS domain-containing protein [Caldichromatium japonicum]